MLKPIKWFDDREKSWSDAATIICEYAVYKYGDTRFREKEEIAKGTDINSWVVSYYNRQTEEPTKEALGFSSMEDAKLWCWNNYNIHMKPYLKL